MAKRPISTPARVRQQERLRFETDEAWRAYVATLDLARAQPELLGNEYFTALQDSAFARFLMLFEAC